MAVLVLIACASKSLASGGRAAAIAANCVSAIAVAATVAAPGVAVSRAAVGRAPLAGSTRASAEAVPMAVGVICATVAIMGFLKTSSMHLVHWEARARGAWDRCAARGASWRRWAWFMLMPTFCFQFSFPAARQTVARGTTAARAVLLALLGITMKCQWERNVVGVFAPGGVIGKCCGHVFFFFFFFFFFFLCFFFPCARA
jgi:hypothetical protein